MAASFTAGTHAAWADQPIVWNLSGIEMISSGNPSGALTGSFTVDGATLNTPNSSLPSFYLTIEDVGWGETIFDSTAGSSSVVFSASSIEFSNSGGDSLDLIFASPLDGSVSPDPLLSTDQTAGAFADVCGGDGCDFTSRTGQANLTRTTIPEPMSLALLGSGLAGLVVARRRSVPA